MGWIALSAGVAVLLVIAFKVWRRWIEPWREVDELLQAINQGRKPPKFLMTGNIRSQPIGLALEKLTQRLREWERVAHEGALGVQTIVGALPDGLVVVDQKHLIQMVNAEFRRAFGVPESDGVGAPLLEVVRDAAIDRAVTAALQDGSARRESMTAPAGDVRREMEVNVVPFRDASKGTAGAVILFRDVSHIRQVEEMRRDFVANVSHELRTPLSIFRGYLETLLDDPRQPPAELIRILEVMERHSDRLTTLVDDVLSLARLESPEARLEFSDIHLPEFLGVILRDWEKRLSAKSLQATLDAPDDLPVIAADENRLQEVIYNLLDNAVKYSQPGGKVWLSARQSEDRVQIGIRDEGAGIPAADLPRVFERFYRADKARSRQIGGTGLGLSIVKHIAQLHGGSVEAESELGRGSTFKVVLPIRPAGVAAECSRATDTTSAARENGAPEESEARPTRDHVTQS
ncbi:MAG: ATP-binding protein [Verrucomicrobiota bacterium]|nr:ATP-binding protein [Verrucomicrobiota bacterium]